MGLYFPDENKSEPKVINSIRGNRDKNPNISDTTKRYLNSENNKSLEIAGLFKHVLVDGLEGAVDSLIRQLGNGEFSFNQLLMDVGLLSYNWWGFLWSLAKKI